MLKIVLNMGKDPYFSRSGYSCFSCCKGLLNSPGLGNLVKWLDVEHPELAIVKNPNRNNREINFIAFLVISFGLSIPKSVASAGFVDDMSCHHCRITFFSESGIYFPITGAISPYDVPSSEVAPSDTPPTPSVLPVISLLSEYDFE